MPSIGRKKDFRFTKESISISSFSRVDMLFQKNLTIDPSDSSSKGAFFSLFSCIIDFMIGVGNFLCLPPRSTVFFRDPLIVFTRTPSSQSICCMKNRISFLFHDLPLLSKILAIPMTEKLQNTIPSCNYSVSAPLLKKIAANFRFSVLKKRTLGADK